jgi:hypothetical protein
MVQTKSRWATTSGGRQDEEGSLVTVRKQDTSNKPRGALLDDANANPITPYSNKTSKAPRKALPPLEIPVAWFIPG